jgi:geranylgeranyl diphosphate synthase type I
VPPPTPTDREDLRARVNSALEAFLARQRPRLAAMSEDLAPIADTLADFVLGSGKRLRPTFAYWGARGAYGADTEDLVAAIAALEWLQACALIHDDVMDGSDTRRGKPSVHRQFATLHRSNSWTGDSEGFGTATAILLGNVALIWADEMLHTAGVPTESLLRAETVYAEMRTELMAGQFLDVLEQALGGGSVERALRVARYKTAKYTVERPLHLGAALMGGSPELAAVYTAYGLPLGEAFQLRDDVLGVFGDPSETGKPAGDDLREGKRTVLVASAFEKASTTQAATLDRFLGDPGLDDDGVRQLREIITDTGALAESERLITTLTDEALAALETAVVEPAAAAVLRELAEVATSRRL